MERKLLSGKSSVALGIFVALFGINQLFLYQTPATYVIAAIFILLGAASGWVGFKSYRHHVPFALKEADELAEK